MADQIAEMKYFQKLLAQHNKALSPNLLQCGRPNLGPW